MASPDPTKTLTLRKRYVVDFNRRWRRVKQLLKQTLVDNDALRLRPSTIQLFQEGEPERDFGNTNNARKVAAFSLWFKDILDKEILGVTNRNGQVSHTDWQNRYLQPAYLRGIKHADTDSRRAGTDVPTNSLPDTLADGILLNQQVHADSLEAIEQRAFSDLEGITIVLLTQVQRIVDDALSQGLTAEQTLTLIIERVDAIGKTRSETLANTATVKTVNDAILNRLEQLGVALVGITPETTFWKTAGDQDVCIICIRGTTQNNGFGPGIYTIDQARRIGSPPGNHPNCRCKWTAVNVGLIPQQRQPQINTNELAQEFEQYLIDKGWNQQGNPGIFGLTGLRGARGESGVSPVVTLEDTVLSVNGMTIDLMPQMELTEDGQLTINGGIPVNLKGEPGAIELITYDGKPGTDGRHGRDGIDGRPGARGGDGIDGRDGVTTTVIQYEHEYTVPDELTNFLQEHETRTLEVDELADRFAKTYEQLITNQDTTGGRLVMARASNGFGAGFRITNKATGPWVGLSLTDKADSKLSADDFLWFEAVKRGGGSGTALAKTINAGDGLTGGGTLESNPTINLDTPGTNSVSSTNVPTGNHTHEITSSSDPGANSSILSTNADGGIELTADPESTPFTINAGTVQSEDLVRVLDALGGTLLVIDSNGRLSIGADETSVIINGVSFDAILNAHTEGSTDLLGIVEHRHSDVAAFGSHVLLIRSRGTEDVETIVQNNDVIGRLDFLGHDGVDYAIAAQIDAEVDGVPGSNDMPGRLIFRVSPDGGQVPSEAMRISEDKTTTLSGTLDTDSDRLKSTETSTTVSTMSDTVELHECNGASDYILTLPAHEIDKVIIITNKNTGEITLTPTSGNIVGESTQKLFRNESIVLKSDGSNWGLGG